ncbi:MAG: EFR1 family ferrodoxin [Treponema sp.]|nr:EFR1 family ferrodoxin [Treponema sp.]
MSNIIFYFSGTGNCLKAAKETAKELGNCEIVSMAKPGGFSILKQYDTIGFIYPVYFYGLPKKVIEFVDNLKLNDNKTAYTYAIATCGDGAGYAIYQIYELLRKNHNIELNYGKKLKMFSNYIVMYNMSKKVDEITKKSNERLFTVIKSIKNRENNKINKFTKLIIFINNWFLKNASKMGKHYNVNENCNGCRICEKVCPVKNIELNNNKPVFNHNCEQCVACIQYCPKQAINYKNATQKRRRYTHPEISYLELSESNYR